MTVTVIRISILLILLGAILASSVLAGFAAYRLSKRAKWQTNHFHTRDDGTFTMVLSDGGRGPPAGGGYYLRIRAGEETADRLVRWETGYFSLDPASLELVALIRVPR